MDKCLMTPHGELAEYAVQVANGQHTKTQTDLTYRPTNHASKQQTNQV